MDNTYGQLYEKNYVEHDKIFVQGTINYTNRYRFYNAIEKLVNLKLAQVAQWRAQKLYGAPIIHIYFDCPDEKMYDRQASRFFALIERARDGGVIIETNTLGPTSGWASTMASMYASPRFRNMYQDSYHYYYETTYDKKTRKTTVSPNKTIMKPDQCLAAGFCDNIFLTNGGIKTR